MTTLKDIESLIDSRLEESIHLDYKGCDSLQNTDGKKAEISKDVSSFANSDGGKIIYGVLEYQEGSKKHLPEKIDIGFDPSELSKEWLENVITSRVHPKIEGVIIEPIKLASGKVIYVVNIPKSATAHQASDKKYYKRFNFKSEPMEDYEIRDTMNRSQLPVVEPIFTHKLQPGYTGASHDYDLTIQLANKGSLCVQNFLLELGIPTQMHVNSVGHREPKEERIIKLESGASAKYSFFSYTKSDSAVIFPNQVITIAPTTVVNRFFRYRITTETQHAYIHSGFSLLWKLYADAMPYRHGEIHLKKLSNF